MTLPGAEKVRVDDRKIRDYLLNPNNSQNRGKATLFGRFGFNRSEWQTLASALKQHPVFNRVVQTSSSIYGTKYTVECNLNTPDGRNLCLHSIWITETNNDHPRLVTAY